jgi:hypothetical protein
MLLERKRQHAKFSKEHHFGRWWPFARQHFLYPLYMFPLYILDSSRDPIVNRFLYYTSILVIDISGSLPI